MRLQDRREQNRRKDGADRDRHDFGDKERSNKAIPQRDKMIRAVSSTGVNPHDVLHSHHHQLYRSLSKK